jgi:hypothetical protein
MVAGKASKKNALSLYVSALKRQQDKESKAKQTKRHAKESEDSSSLEDSLSVYNSEKPIPRKLSNKTPVAKGGTKRKPTNNTNGKKNNEEIDIGSLSAVKKMQIDDKYDMLDSDDDVLSLMMIRRFPSLVLMSEGYPWNKIIGLMLVSLMTMNQHKKLLNVLLPWLNYYIQRKGLKSKNY